MIERLRYFLLAIDPGLLQSRHGAKTVLAVIIALESFRSFNSDAALYAGIGAGFLMQSTAGTARKTRQITMAAMGLASVAAVGLGSALSGRTWAKEILLVLAAFAAFYVRRWIPGKAMFPMFAFILMLLATVQPGGAKSGWLMMLAVLTGSLSAFTVYFFVVRDESLYAFRNAADLFLHRLQRGLRNPAKAKADLRAMHRVVTFEEEEREHLGSVAPELFSTVLSNQYEALQVLILLADMEGRQHAAPKSKVAAARFSREYLDQVISELERMQPLLST